MDYKDLLDRYKKGLVNDEEKKIIEEEIKKHEAFEEYMVENFEDQLSEIKMDADEKKGTEETVKLKKNVNRRLRNNIIKSVIIVVLLYVGIFYGVSSIVDSMYYDPTAKTQSVKKENQRTDFYYDMQAYVNLNIPGNEVGFITTEQSKGFGEYDISYSLSNLFDKTDQRYFASLTRDGLTSDNIFDGIKSNQNLFGIWDGFDVITYNLLDGNDKNEEDLTIWGDVIEERNGDTLKYLEELNPLSYISMSIVFDEDLSMEEFYGDLKMKYPMINFSWVGVRTIPKGERWSENQPAFLVGFNPKINLAQSLNENPDLPNYPLFTLEDFSAKSNITQEDLYQDVAKAYETHFKSQLEYIKDQEEFVERFDYNYLKTDFYKDSLAYVNENGVKTYGVLAYATAEDFLEYIDELPYASIYINEVLPTKPNIYHN